jgi:hypothetical protein
MLGLRFLQASLLVPLHRNAPVGTRALPIRFQEVSRIKRPGKKATDEIRKQYREAVKQKNLSRSFVDMGRQLRQELDQAGGRDKVLVLAGDGSFCNRTVSGGIKGNHFRRVGRVPAAENAGTGHTSVTAAG